MFYLLSCAFGADDQMGVFALAEHLDHLFHEVVLVTTVDGNGTEFLQGPTQNATTILEELDFHHGLEIDALRPIEGQADEEVLDGGMWCNDANGVAEVRVGVDHFPSSELEPRFPYELFKSHFYGNCRDAKTCVSTIYY